MSGRNDNAFERQLDREIDRLAGPDPAFDVREVVARASGSRSTRRRWFGGNLFVPAALVVVLAFGALMIVSGVLTPSDDAAIVGASPSPQSTTVEAPADKVHYADGTFAEIEIDWDRLQPMIDAGEFAPGPEEPFGDQVGEPSLLSTRLFAVSSSDPRLSGDAVVVSMGDSWAHTVTVDDIDDPLPNGLWSLDAEYGRMQLRNADGAWEGPVGPVFRALGEDPPDGVPGNAPSLEGRTPAVLSGSGAYAGLTAYLSFHEPESASQGVSLVDEGAFEALIVNAGPVGQPSPGALTEGRDWIESLRDAGLTE